jgi:hypothetical protein
MKYAALARFASRQRTLQDSIRFALLTRKPPAPRAPNCLALDARLASRHNFPVETRCAQCNAPMTCQPEGDCWCAELPHVIPMPAADTQSTGCLCRACLLKKIKAAGASSASGILPISNSSAPRD